MYHPRAFVLLALVACGDNLKAADVVDAPPPSVDAPPPPIDAAPPAVSSVRVGNDATYEGFEAVTVAADGTVFAAGLAQGGAGATDGFVATFDRDDQLTGARALGTNQSDDFHGAVSDGGSGAVLVGASGDAQALGVAVHVAADLSVTAARGFGGSMRPGSIATNGGQSLNAIAQVSGGFVAAGETYPGTLASSGTSWILALDAALAPRWERAIHDGIERSAARAVATSGGRALIGSHASISASAAVFRVTALDDGSSSPTTAWVRQLEQLVVGEFNRESVTAIAIAPGGGSWAVGYSDIGGGFVGQISKLDAGGAVLGLLRIESGGNPILRTVVPTADGGCIVAGDAGNHGLILKLDADLGVTWQQSVGVDAISRIHAAARAPDGSIVFAGIYGNDGWLLRLRDVTAAPADFGTTATTLPVTETAGSSNTATMNTPAWASTSAAWTPTVTDLSALTVGPAT